MPDLSITMSTYAMLEVKFCFAFFNMSEYDSLIEYSWGSQIFLVVM